MNILDTILRILGAMFGGAVDAENETPIPSNEDEVITKGHTTGIPAQYE